MLVKFNPFNAALSRDTVLDDFFSANFPIANRAFEPKIDVRETENDFVVAAELPGLQKDDFKLTIENNVLTIEGEKKSGQEEKRDNYYRRERSYGAFRRSFRLAEGIDSKHIKAEYNNGILEVTIPKGEKAKAKNIEVSVK